LSAPYATEPVNYATYGAERPASTRHRTAVGRRSMVRMGPSRRPSRGGLSMPRPATWVLGIQTKLHRWATDGIKIARRHGLVESRMRGDTHVRFGGAGRGTRSSERAIPRPGPTPKGRPCGRPPAAAVLAPAATRRSPWEPAPPTSQQGRTPPDDAGSAPHCTATLASWSAVGPIVSPAKGGRTRSLFSSGGHLGHARAGMQTRDEARMGRDEHRQDNEC
jgi:hypothetical protein